MNLKAFGNKLRELRKNAGLTNDVVAKSAGIACAILSKIETGKYVAPLPQFQKILKTLGCIEAETEMLEHSATLCGRVEISTDEQPPAVISLIVALYQRVESNSLDEATAKKMHKLLVA